MNVNKGLTNYTSAGITHREGIKDTNSYYFKQNTQNIAEYLEDLSTEIKGGAELTRDEKNGLKELISFAKHAKPKLELELKSINMEVNKRPIKDAINNLNFIIEVAQEALEPDAPKGSHRDFLD